MQAVFGSSGVFGLGIGSISSGTIIKYGRKNAMLSSSIIGLVGVLI